MITQKTIEMTILKQLSLEVKILNDILYNCYLRIVDSDTIIIYMGC